MTNATIAGVGMTRFGKHMDIGLKALGREALLLAIEDAGIDKEAIEVAYVGNAMAGLITGQECIRGQVVLRSAGIGAIPVINVENACASASTAWSSGWTPFPGRTRRSTWPSISRAGSMPRSRSCTA